MVGRCQQFTLSPRERAGVRGAGVHFRQKLVVVSRCTLHVRFECYYFDRLDAGLYGG